MVFTLLVISAAIFRLTGYRNPTSAISFPDSGCFTGTAAVSIFSPEFYLGIRPFFVPLFYKVCGNTEGAIVTGQILFALVTRSLLAFALFQVLGRSVAGCFGAALLLAFSYAHPAAAWDQIVLSESVSLSLHCLLFALLLLSAHTLADARLRTGPHLKVCVVLTVLTAGAFGFTRDSNIYTVQLLIPLGVLAAAWLYRIRGPWKILAAATVMVLLTASLQSSLMNHSKRWQFPFFNLLGQRILADETLLNHFRSAGLPVTPDLMKHTGKWASDDNYAIYGAPGVLPWVEQHAVSTWKSWLIFNPGYTLKPAWGQLDISLRQPVRDKTIRLEASQPSWFAPIGSWMHPQGAAPVRITFLLLVLMSVTAWVRRDATALTLLAAVAWLFLTSFVQVMINYHGDPMEFNRHVLPAVFGFRLALWVTVALALHQTVKLMAAPQLPRPRAHPRNTRTERRGRLQAVRS